jgi:hypothetical protein
VRVRHGADAPQVSQQRAERLHVHVLGAPGSPPRGQEILGGVQRERRKALGRRVPATVKTAGLNTLTWLTAYLGECGRNGGKPLTGKALDRFLPWTASPEDLRAWPSLRHPDKNPREITPSPAPGPLSLRAGRRHALLQDFRRLTYGQPKAIGEMWSNPRTAEDCAEAIRRSAGEVRILGGRPSSGHWPKGARIC